MLRFFSWVGAVVILSAIAHGQPSNPPKTDPPKADTPAKDNTPQPQLLAKGEKYLVHLVPATSPTKDRPGRPMMVTHTNRETGEMRVLAEADASAPFKFGGDFLTQSINTRGISGVRADDERVYIITTHWEYRSSPAAGVTMNKFTAELRVFWLADGSSIGKWTIEGMKTPFEQSLSPNDRVLHPTVDGVVVRGQAFLFAGKKFVARGLPDTPVVAPAPVWLAGGEKYRVYAVSPLPMPAGLADAKGRDAVGTSILYIPLPAGDPKTLLLTGDRPATGEKKGLLAQVTQTRIVSTMMDNERLYVLVWHGRWEREGLAMAVPRPLSHLSPSDEYRLYVFWLADGSDLTPVKVLAKEAKVPAETLRGDSLQSVPSGVKVFGETTITFKGKERVK
ncbi:MAG: hypothetical protein L0241_22495 [Planctomycetia bacterium]|nr:hypothetical protein [Planctomycetia bacterium]